MISIINILDLLLFILFLVNIIYLVIFSLASLKKLAIKEFSDGKIRKIAILIPSYKEDNVILECVDSCMDQDYPKESYEIVVISDRMREDTLEKLSKLPIKVVNVYFENSTKAKALNHAMDSIGENYDTAIILDADNTIPQNFLTRTNNLFSTINCRIIQAHRCAKNLNTHLALLDAVSEEINNSIFRKGHVNMGLSSALIGSGMCFDYNLFKQTMLSIDAVGGFDRALELTFLKENEKIAYISDLDIWDEKVQYKEDFSRQRRRWISAQLHYLNRTAKDLPKAIINGNWDFCDKIFQQMSIPRVMLLGFTGIIALVLTIIDTPLSIKWWVLLLTLIFAMVNAIPKYLIKKELFIAALQLPYFFVLMTLNLFKIKGANKKFIHTSHGINKETSSKNAL